MNTKYRIVKLKAAKNEFVVQELVVQRQLNLYRGGLILPPLRGQWVSVSSILDTIEQAESFVQKKIDSETFEVVKVYE